MTLDDAARPRCEGVLVALGREPENPNAQAAAPAPASVAPASGGNDLGSGVSPFILATAVVAAFLGGIGSAPSPPGRPAT